MPRLSPEEKLKQLQQQEATIKAEKKKLLARQNAQKRKARTRLFIQYGAIAAKYLDVPNGTEPKEFEKVMQRIVAVLKVCQSEKAEDNP